MDSKGVAGFKGLVADNNIHKMRVIKRDGRYEIVSLDKVQKRIQALSEDLQSIDPIVIAQKVCAQINDGIHASQLDEFAANLCTAMITENPEYGILGSRIIISNNHKNTSPSFSETMEVLYNNRDIHGKSVPLISDAVYRITMENKHKINSVIDHERDYTYDYFAFKTLERGYLINIKGKTIERIQHMLMRVSLGIHAESQDLQAALRSYEFMSGKYFTHASPTLFHAGTPHPALLSCFLLHMDDSVESMYKVLGDCAQISKWAGGIGVNILGVRSSGAQIRSTNGKSSGIIPLLRVMNSTARHIDQSGRRKGSIAVYVPDYHPDIFNFLDLRKNHGAEEERCRDLFTAMWLSNLFMDRVLADTEWSLMDPDECPGLADAYGDEFKELYERYEREGRARKAVKAQELWTKIVTAQMEGSIPYILYKDAANNKSNQKNVGTIKSSNLCAEILEYSSASEYACCTLASISLPSFVRPAPSGASGLPLEFDFDKMIEVVEVVVNNLNKVIDINMYPVPETELSNKRHRPLGVGVQGLADVYMMMGYNFDSDEARRLNREIFEALYYGCISASAKLAERDGPYETFAGSPISQGLFQFDLWEKYDGIKVELSGRWDWEALRRRVMTTGVRNSLLVALMPTASTSQILGNNEAFEPYTSNIYTRRTIAGDFICVNNHLMADLKRLGLWSPEVREMIIRNQGSVQEIEGIPLELRKLYRTVWQMPQKAIIDQAADRGPFICQTQSMNLFFEDVTFKKLSSALFYGYKRGLKTGSYYIRTRPKVNPQQFTIEPEMRTGQTQKLTAEEEAKLICSLTNREACEMCSA